MSELLIDDTNRNSALWNAVETIISAWAQTLEASLQSNTEPSWDRPPS